MAEEQGDEPEASDHIGSSHVGSSRAADGATMRRLQNGEDTALNELMDRWRKPILAYLYRVIGDYETAADLTQEVFVLIYRNRRRYREKGVFSSWIFTIAANLTRNHFRWKKRHPEAELSDEAFSSLGMEQSSPSGQLETSETAAQVKAAVLKLPEKFRTPVILFHFSEFPQAEIARIMGCTEKTVETRLYRARKLLREELEESLF